MIDRTSTVLPEFRGALPAFPGPAGWACLFQSCDDQSLHPLRRQTITHQPRISRALRASDQAHDLGRAGLLAKGYKIHDRKPERKLHNVQEKTCEQLHTVQCGCVTTSPRFVIEYLNGNLRHTAKDSRSLPVRAASPEEAVVRVLGGPAESWDGNHFTMWGGKLRGRVEEMHQ